MIQTLNDYIFHRYICQEIKIIKCQEKILDSIFFCDIITIVLLEKGV